jgi:hypothetical protein
MNEPCNHIWNAHRQCQWCHRDKNEVDYEDGKAYLVRLLGIVAQQCEPLDTLTGLVSQLDNYITGIAGQRKVKPKRRNGETKAKG